MQFDTLTSPYQTLNPATQPLDFPHPETRPIIGHLFSPHPQLRPQLPFPHTRPTKTRTASAPKGRAGRQHQFLPQHPQINQLPLWPNRPTLISDRDASLMLAPTKPLWNIRCRRVGACTASVQVSLCSPWRGLAVMRGGSDRTEGFDPWRYATACGQFGHRNVAGQWPPSDRSPERARPARVAWPSTVCACATQARGKATLCNPDQHPNP
jgi:hypothetical protein